MENFYELKKEQPKTLENVYNPQYNVYVGKYWKKNTSKIIIILEFIKKNMNDTFVLNFSILQIYWMKLSLLLKVLYKYTYIFIHL